MRSADASGSEAPLLAVLRARIAEQGPLPVDEYMRLCLADPVHGYWQRGDIIGAEGDFITAPEISQVFGELVGLWSAVVWRGMGQPSPVRLVELGPGRGTLMRDALRAGRVTPDFLAAATIHLIETSSPLRELQRQTLGFPLPPPRAVPSPLAGTSPPPSDARPSPLVDASPPPGGEGLGVGGSPTIDVRESPPPSPSPTRGEGTAHGGGVASVTWHEAIEEVPPGPAILIANEFLDALPIRQLVRDEQGWRERVVELDAQNKLRFAIGGRADGVLTGATSQVGDVLELRPAEHQLLASLARREAPLVALFVDYGPAEARCGDTLQAVRRHAWVDPLTDPGRVDLTAHVQFSRLADTARSVGLAADGPMPQAEFLGRLGVAERAARLMSSNPAIAAAIEAGVQRLLSPTGMGGLFKAMAVRSPGLPPVPPFG